MVQGTHPMKCPHCGIELDMSMIELKHVKYCKKSGVWIIANLITGSLDWKFCTLCGGNICENRMYVTPHEFPKKHAHINCIRQMRRKNGNPT